ncbi:hypothetical protein mRhiFer1_001785 [Rhinolophus ferrumequinum]|uniref:Uncharacterized protein n=1 Tax=Rhinolophus ferrumequinum TaxID=59479 RepID=A0A7J7X373_RHIFE|nr:hypothetical protein mRhiFer1_001785 [Rhinolophus ferrumequinum]
MWQEGQVAAARAWEQRLARASIAHWRSLVQGRWADRQRRRTRVQQAFLAWRVALGQRWEAQQQAEKRVQARAQVALCWTLWVREFRLHRLSRAHAARKLSTRVLEIWAQSAAQGRVQRVTMTQFQQAGPRRLLQTHWAQWRTALLRVWLEPRAEAQNTRSCRPQATGSMLPSPTQHRSLGGQRKWKETSWAQSNRVPPLGLQWPGCANGAQGWPRTGPGEDCRSETSAIKGKGQVETRRKHLRRWPPEALLCRLQVSQQARRLAVTWQRWVDAAGTEELGRTLLRQWHLRRAWRTWRQRVVRLRVVRRLQQPGGWAFEKWHQSLAARGQRRGATSSPRPREQGGHQEPWGQAGSCLNPCV